MGHRLPLALAAVAAVPGCVCCAGGLADSLSPPVAIGLLGTAAAFGGAAAVVAFVRVRRPFRAVRDAVTERLDRLTALGTSDVVDYRINDIHIDSTNGDTDATVTATLSMADGTERRVYLRLFPHGGQWTVDHVRGLPLPPDKA